MARKDKETIENAGAAEGTAAPAADLKAIATEMNEVLGLNPPIDVEALDDAALAERIKLEAGSIGVKDGKVDAKLYDADKQAFKPETFDFLGSIGALDHTKDLLAEREAAASKPQGATKSSTAASSTAGTGSPVIPAFKQMDALKAAINEGGGTADEIIAACDRISKEKGGKGCTTAGKDDIKWLFDLMSGVAAIQFKDGKITKA